MLRFFLLVGALWFSLAGSLAVAEAKPRIAIWNPETSTSSSRFKIDLDWLNQVAQWLAESGADTSRLSIDQLQDAEEFSAAKFDGLMLPGDAFPRRATLALQKFSADGGLLISLGAGPVPFLAGIEKYPDGVWMPSPVTPDKGWETSEIYGKVLGLAYNDVPARRDDGTRHEATPLFKKYLPPLFDVPLVEKKLPSRWLVPRPGAEIFPLMRSYRADGSDSVPQLFIVRNKTPEGTRMGIVAISDFFTRNSPTSPQFAPQTVIALAKIAADLKNGLLPLSPEQKMDLRDDETEPLPIEK